MNLRFAVKAVLNTQNLGAVWAREISQTIYLTKVLTPIGPQNHVQFMPGQASQGPVGYKD